MKKLSEIYKEQGIAFAFPIEIKDEKGYETYYENGGGYWRRRENDSDGNETYYEQSDGDWYRTEYDDNGNETYYENSDGYWWCREYDANGGETYYENSNGFKQGTPNSASCAGKVIEVDGKKYKLTEV